MKNYIWCVLSCMLFINYSNAQSWNEFITKKGPVKFDDAVEIYKKERAIKSAQRISGEVVISDRKFEKEGHLFDKWYIYNKPRLDSEGNITNTLWRTMQAETAQQQSSSLERSLPHGAWESIGPTNNNTTLVNPATTGFGIGRVNSITFNSGNLFLGTASGGAWKGTGNNTWQSISQNIPNLSVSSICVNPLNPSIIYILTGDADGHNNGPSNTSIGVIKSIDGGISWTTTGLAWTDVSTIIGFKMIMHPVNPEILYVAGNAGIHRTDDGGITWTTYNGYFTDIEFKPGNPNFMYAVSATHFYTTTTGGVNGWTQMTEPAFSQSASRMAIAVSANRPNWVYVLVGSKIAPFFVGLWLSTNSGVSFGASRSSISPCIVCDNGGTVSQALYDLAFTANPANAKEIWMGGINVYNSLDSGSTWTKRSSYYSLNADIMHPDIHTLEYSPSGELWCGNDGGVYKYTPSNFLVNWSPQSEGLNITQFYGFGLDATPPYDQNYFGAQDNGQMRYDGDANFETVYMGDGGGATVDPVNDVYYFNGNGQLFKSTCFFYGCDITPNVSMCNCIDTSYFIGGVEPNRPIKIDPVNHTTVYHGLNCLWKSLNSGDSMFVVPGFDCTGGMIHDVDITPVSKWAVKGAMVLRETGQGNWINVTNALSQNAETISRIAAHPVNPLEAYVSYWSYNSTVKVFYTVDGGVNWNNLSAGLPNVPVNDIIYQNGSDGGYYVATDIGVYYINNSMFFWMPFRNGMPSVVVTELEINYGQNKIYASTYGRGAWASDLINPCPATDATNLYPALFGYSLIQANNTVTANSSFNHGFGENVTLLSGNEIYFTTGFEVANGTELTARIQPCPPLTQSANNQLAGYFIPKTGADQNTTMSKHSADADFILHPNPANEYCNVDITLKENSDIKIELFNLTGVKISEIQNLKNNIAGNYRFSLNLIKVVNGVYIIKSTYNNISRSDKLILTH